MWLWNMDTAVTPLQNTHPPSGPARGASTLARAAEPDVAKIQVELLHSRVAHEPSDRVGVDDAGAVHRIPPQSLHCGPTRPTRRPRRR